VTPLFFVPLALFAQTRIPSLRPMDDATAQLEELYGKVVTYEEPPVPLMQQVFLMPAVGGANSNLPADVNKMVSAWRQQALVPHFRLLTSRLGYHVVPVTGAVLDARVTVPVKSRTPEEHMRALETAVSVASGTMVDMGGFGMRPGGFDSVFDSYPQPFPWGASHMVARDALVNLLLRSATTFTWHMKCQASPSPFSRLCALNPGRIPRN
jgi:hypothetical protein